MKPPSTPRRPSLPWLAWLAIPLAVAAAEGLGWWWMHPPADQRGLRLLEYTFPSSRDGCAAWPLEVAVTDQLQCNRGQSGLIQAGPGRHIEVNYFAWDDTNATGLAQAFGHAPELCMGTMGLKVAPFLPNRTYRLNGADLVFDSTQFRDKSGAPLYIFKLAWAEGMDGINLLREGPRGAELRTFRIKAVARRWRPRFARVLMLGVFGAADAEDAWNLARFNVLDELRLASHPETSSPAPLPP